MDDDSDTCIVVKTILEKAGYEVVSKSRAKDALSVIKDNKFDLLLIDIMMPDMSGWELFNSVMKEFPHNKIVILSIIKLPSEKIDELLKLGLKDYITKPFDKQDFVNRVEQAIRAK